MRLLLLTPALPYPAHQGGAMRNLGILRGLHAGGHSVRLLSFTDAPPIDTAPLHALCTSVDWVLTPPRTTGRRLRDLLLSDRPDLAQRLDSPAFRERLTAMLKAEAFDLIQFEGLEMAIYLPLVRQLQPKARLVYDAHNAEYALQAVIASVEVSSLKRLPGALYSRIQARRIAAFERYICQQADAVIAVSDEDAAALRPFRRDQQVFVLPNGVFSEDYISAAPLDLEAQALVFTGKMDYRPNVDAMLWFASAVLPRIRSEFPQVRLYIVGQKPHPAVTALSEPPLIEVTGWVAEVQPFLHAARVYVAPLRMGSGTRLKLLEAMAAGCAIVATPIAAAGLRPEAQAALKLAGDDAGFAQAVIDLLRDPAEQRRRGEAARRAVQHYYDWTALTPCLHAIHEEIQRGR